jgi:hypothetical protein
VCCESVSEPSNESISISIDSVPAAVWRRDDWRRGKFNKMKMKIFNWKMDMWEISSHLIITKRM